MNTLRIDDKLLNEYNEFEQNWSKSNDMIIEMDISISKLDDCVLLLLSKLPNNFACLLLSEIVENYEMNETQLSDIFLNGDVGCKVSVCLKPNLTDNIQQLCRNSGNKDVVEHFEQKYN